MPGDQPDPLMDELEHNEAFLTIFDRLAEELILSGVNLNPQTDIEHLYEPEVNLEALSFIAGRIVALDRFSGTTARRLEYRRQTRVVIISYLWYRDLWHTVWKELVDREVPGPALTADEVARLNEERLDYKARQDRQFAETEAQIIRLGKILFDHGYPDAATDRIIIAYLLVRHSQHWVEIGQPGMHRLDLLSIIQQHAGYPDHPAWEVVISDILG